MMNMMMSDAYGMTMAEAKTLIDSLAVVGRRAIFVYKNPDGTYRAEWEGQEVVGENPFQLDSHLDGIGAPAGRDLFLIREDS
jgi:hypothetical protein